MSAQAARARSNPSGEAVAITVAPPHFPNFTALWATAPAAPLINSVWPSTSPLPNTEWAAVRPGIPMVAPLSKLISPGIGTACAASNAIYSAAVPLAVPNPYPLADPAAIDLCANSLDNAGAIAVGNNHFKGWFCNSGSGSSTGFYVRRVNSLAYQPHQDLTGGRTGHWSFK